MIDSTFLDSVELSIKCPRCENVIVKKVGWLKSNTDITCDGCHGVIRNDAEQLQRALDEATEAFKKLGRDISKMD